MIQQLELPERTHAPVSVSPADKRIDELIALLRRCKRWHKRAAIFRALKLPDRLGRILAAASGGMVTSTSRLGYRHTLLCTPGEFAEADNELKSRIEELTRLRADRQRIWHSAGRVREE